MQVVALLPMKGYSERIPKKNLKEFAGSPMYHAVVKALKGSKYISKVIINSDSLEILEDAKNRFGDFVKCVVRPETLYGDFISMNKIIKHDLVNEDAEYFMQTHATNPLLTSETIDKAIEYYLNNQDRIDSVFSVTKIQARFYDKNSQPINHNLSEMLRTQDLEPYFEENSNFYIFSKKAFYEAGENRIGLNPKMFEMEKLEAVDIDWPEDFIIAELLYKSKIIEG